MWVYEFIDGSFHVNIFENLDDNFESFSCEAQTVRALIDYICIVKMNHFKFPLK